MSPSSTLSEGALVLVTGVNGFIATHVANQFLLRGFKVRGTVRDKVKSEWLVKELWKTESSNGSFELVEVKDMAAENAYAEALRGVEVVVHLATDTTWDPDPNKVVPRTVAAITNLLDDAVKEPSIKQFVYTSSMGSAITPYHDVAFHCDQNSWNDEALERAWAPPPYTAERGMYTYMASKAEAEKTFWKFIKEQKPSFVANSVLPFTALGPLLNSRQNTSTDGWLFDIYKGNPIPVSPLKAMGFVDVRDVAVLHVAAALDPDVKDYRLYGWSESFNWNDTLALFKKLRPEEKFMDDLEGQGQILGTYDDTVERRLLKTWANLDDWTELEVGLRDTIEGPWPVGK